MASPNYKAALKSIRAIQDGRNNARNEEAMASLMGAAERERDRIKVEKEQERMQRRQGVANIIGTTAAVAAGIVGTPALGAVVGGAVTMGARGVANSGWKGRNNNITFAQNREMLRDSLRPNIQTEIAMGANAAATGFQAGKLADSIAISNQLKNGTDPLMDFARESDFSRVGRKVTFNAENVRQRAVRSFDMREMSVPSIYETPLDDPTQVTRLNIRNIIKNIR